MTEFQAARAFYRVYNSLSVTLSRAEVEAAVNHPFRPMPLTAVLDGAMQAAYESCLERSAAAMHVGLEWLRLAVARYDHAFEDRMYQLSDHSIRSYYGFPSA